MYMDLHCIAEILATSGDFAGRHWWLLWRRCYCRQHDLPPEHPRASTTDDVECFFSVLRDSVGKDFTLKEVKTFSPPSQYVTITV